MAELKLHIELAEGTDIATAARQFEERLAVSPDIGTLVLDRDQQKRDGGAVQFFLAQITLAGQVAGSVTAIIGAVEKLQQLAKAAAGSPSVQRILMVVGRNRVPIEELTDKDKQTIAKNAGAA
jgi:hypothetical protein